MVLLAAHTCFRVFLACLARFCSSSTLIAHLFVFGLWHPCVRCHFPKCFLCSLCPHRLLPCRFRRTTLASRVGSPRPPGYPCFGESELRKSVKLVDLLSHTSSATLYSPCRVFGSRPLSSKVSRQGRRFLPVRFYPVKSLKCP